MGKVKFNVDYTKYPIKAVVNVEPEAIKEWSSDEDKKYNWVKLYNGRKYRTKVKGEDIQNMIDAAKAERDNLIPSDTICKTDAELAYEEKKAILEKLKRKPHEIIS